MNLFLKFSFIWTRIHLLWIIAAIKQEAKTADENKYYGGRASDQRYRLWAIDTSSLLAAGAGIGGDLKTRKKSFTCFDFKVRKALMATTTFEVIADHTKPHSKSLLVATWMCLCS